MTSSDGCEKAGLTVYYDASCPLCRSEIGLYRKLASDCPVAFVDVSAAASGERVSADLDAGDAMRRFHVRDADGRLHSGAAAFARLWDRYAGFRWLGWLLRLPPLLWLAEGSYRVFLVTLRPLMQYAARWRAGTRESSS